MSAREQPCAAAAVYISLAAMYRDARFLYTSFLEHTMRYAHAPQWIPSGYARLCTSCPCMMMMPFHSVVHSI